MGEQGEAARTAGRCGRRATVAIAIVAVAAALLAGCGDDDRDSADDAVPATTTTIGPTSTSAPGTSQSSDAGTATTGTAASFPVTVVDDRGEVTLDAAPQTIVSLSPSLTETLFAVGAGDQVAAVDSASDYPDGTPMTDLSGFRPNVEAIGGYEPDLVVVSRDRDDLAATLEGIGIPVLVLGTPHDLDGLYDQIGTVGAATGHGDEAADLVASMRTEIDDAARRRPHGRGARRRGRAADLLLRAQRGPPLADLGRPRRRGAGLARAREHRRRRRPGRRCVPPAHRRST